LWEGNCHCVIILKVYWYLICTERYWYLICTEKGISHTDCTSQSGGSRNAQFSEWSGLLALIINTASLPLHHTVALAPGKSMPLVCGLTEVRMPDSGPGEGCVAPSCVLSRSQTGHLLAEPIKDLRSPARTPALNGPPTFSVERIRHEKPLNIRQGRCFMDDDDPFNAHTA